MSTKIQDRYYLIVDDYYESSAHNSSRGILYHGSELEHANVRDLNAALQLHVFETPFEKVWGKMFSSKDKDVILSVYGSLFVEMIFGAYARYRLTKENSGSFACVKEAEVSHINILKETFCERVDGLLGLMRKYKKQHKCEVKVDIVFTHCYPIGGIESFL